MTYMAVSAKGNLSPLGFGSVRQNVWESLFYVITASILPFPHDLKKWYLSVLGHMFVCLKNVGIIPTENFPGNTSGRSSGEMSHSFREGNSVCMLSLCLNTNRVMCLSVRVSSSVWQHWSISNLRQLMCLYYVTKLLSSLTLPEFQKLTDIRGTSCNIWHETRWHFHWHFLTEANKQQQQKKSIAVRWHFSPFRSCITKIILQYEARTSSLLYQLKREVKDLEVTHPGGLK